MAVCCPTPACTPSPAAPRTPPRTCAPLRTFGGRLTPPERILVQLGHPAPRHRLPDRLCPSDNHRRRPRGHCGDRLGRGHPLQRRGIATEAAQGLLAWLRKHPVHTVIAYIHPDHQASAAVATTVGLTPTNQWHDGEIKWQLTIS
ncbi:GNAT family N-acetyltransferase [Streptomyces sp. NPDC006475]|uniref:GNAT family N-acetyltransferase n=1 Tax=Streptomyces sp. NPDC006475 TaxID=3155719 RepID=UPI0033BC9D24